MIKITKRPGRDENDHISVFDVELETGWKFLMKSTDPYGYFHFELEGKGPLPKLLEGKFTSYSDANRALVAFNGIGEVFVPEVKIPPKTSELPKTK